MTDTSMEPRTASGVQSFAQITVACPAAISPLPYHQQMVPLIDAILVHFRYTLRVPNWAGPICAEKERLKFGPISPLVRLES